MARREAGEGEQPVAGLLEAVGGSAAFQALWPEELVQGGFYDLERRQHVIPPGAC